jgi:hypothetical protein
MRGILRQPIEDRDMGMAKGSQAFFERSGASRKRQKTGYGDHSAFSVQHQGYKVGRRRMTD